MPETVAVRLFGAFEVSRGARTEVGLANRKAQELLALVLLAPDGVVRREVAAEYLWPSAAPDASRKAIRQVLWQIHNVTDGAEAEPRLLVTDGESIRLNPGRGIWVDVNWFVRAVQTYGRVPSDELSDAQLRPMIEAAELHRGPLLSGCYDDWCVVHRENLDDMYLTLLDRLSLAYEQRGELAASIEWARALLEVEPAHERTHRRLMRLYYAADDRTRALRQYRRCRWVLERELGVSPSTSTQALAAAIGADSLGGHVDSTTATDPTDLLSSLRVELEALRISVEAITTQISRSLA